MTTTQQNLIRQNFAQFTRTDDRLLTARFFDRLFYIAPEVRALFLSAASDQPKKLVAMLRYMVRNLHQPEEVGLTVSLLAQRHVGSRLKPYQYAIVGNALLWTLEQTLGDTWTDDAEDAWADYYALLSEIMVGVHRRQRAVA